MLEVGLAECRNEERKDQSKKETRKLKGQTRRLTGQKARRLEI